MPEGQLTASVLSVRLARQYRTAPVRSVPGKDGVNRNLETPCRRAGISDETFRVLREGKAAAGDKLALINRDPRAFTIARANKVMFGANSGEADIRALLEVPALSESWRKTLTRRLNG